MKPMTVTFNGVASNSGQVTFADTVVADQSYLPYAGVANILNVSLVDNAGSTWCATVGHCPTTGPQTLTKIITLLSPPGVTQSMQIQDVATNLGLRYLTANYAAIFNVNPSPRPVIPWRQMQIEILWPMLAKRMLI